MKNNQKVCWQKNIIIKNKLSVDGIEDMIYGILLLTLTDKDVSIDNQRLRTLLKLTW